ncbi:PAS domain-containing protein [Phenylobacterium hankyongense]|uniref:PAS domain-containing protein n=1 Tax=Phenylobacterium hankyongense TaxID=1813876 RepID=A0A328AXW1_9CAUL|nr:PAS domain-containing protein [Phenylobacterium hankyongense]RAK58434.1 PAS domain-containing protein [Phenylobacterium hankyongense]
MFHANTERLIEYWASRALPGRAPNRSAIQPADFRQLMPQTFILGREARGLYPVRLAGGLIAELHQLDLRGVNGLALWSERDRLRLQTALEEIRTRPEPLVAVAEVLTDGASLPMEVLFAPLTADDGGPDRYLGLYQPLSMVARLQGRAALELSVRSLRRPGAANEQAPRVRLAAIGGRLIA